MLPNYNVLTNNTKMLKIVLIYLEEELDIHTSDDTHTLKKVKNLNLDKCYNPV